VSSPEELLRALDQTGRPAILKTRRFGYDGKGQISIPNGSDPAAAWRAIGAQPAILEGFVPFEREVSMVAARSRDGQVECFELIENEHRDHILKTSRVPADVPGQLRVEAKQIAEAIAAGFAYVGVLAVEMFVLPEGAEHRILVNEIAPRVHNSGHWTIDGASVSQFELHVRAIAGWPLARPLRHGRIEMINLIGSEIEDYARWLPQPGASVHLYGKGAARPGRKMGHVTRVTHEPG
jgi:5-(carboxyamino)imidazole ribonucleotide synthase